MKRFIFAAVVALATLFAVPVSAQQVGAGCTPIGRGAVNAFFSDCTAVTGTANAIILTPTFGGIPTTPQLVIYTQYRFQATATNTTATTIRLGASGPGPYAVYTNAGTALSGGEIVSGRWYTIGFDPALNSAAGGWRLISGQASPPGVPSILDYGAKCDNATDDGPAVQSALNANKVVTVPAASNYCIINTSVSIPAGATIYAEATGINFNGAANCFKTSAAIDMFVLAGGDVSLIGVCFQHDGASGRIIADTGAKLGSNIFNNVSFNATNNSNGDPLVYFNSSANITRGCRMSQQRPTAYGFFFDAKVGVVQIANEVNSCLFGGVNPAAGHPIFVGSSDGTARQEGFIYKNNQSVMQGPSNLWIDAVLGMQVEGNIFDQAWGNNIIFNSSAFGVSDVIFVNNYISTPNQQTSGVCVTQLSTTHSTNNITFSGNSFRFCGFGVTLAANANNWKILGNNFDVIGSAGIVVNGSSGIIIDSNTTANVGANFSYSIADGASGGPITVTNNQWDPAGNIILNVTTPSKYRWANNTGAGGAFPAALTSHTAASSGALAVSNNLSDLASASTARTNLGLGALATVVPGTGVATALTNGVNTSGGVVTSPVANANLANSATTVNGQICTLGSSCIVTATASNALTIGTHLTGASYNGSAPVTIATDAVSTNTASTLVARDGSGNFAAGTITANLTGTASTSTVATTSTVTTTGTNSTFFLPFVSAITGNLGLGADNDLTYNPSTNTLTAVNFSGALAGNASTATALATPRSIYGNNFDGTANLAQIIASTFGGTGNGFTKFSGPVTSEKTFTLPNASAVVLTDNAAVTAVQGGTGITTYAVGDTLYASAVTPTLAKLTIGGAGTIYRSTGTLPTWSTATYPNTVTANRLLYASASNTINDLATANSSILVTDGGGVPSLSTTLPAFTLGGTVAGGGNQINNVIIGTTTPLGGSFTTVSASTSLTSPLHVGGIGTTGTQLSLQTTTGNGTTDQFAFLGGNNGATTFGTWSAAALTISAALRNSTAGTFGIYAATGFGVDIGDVGSGGVASFSRAVNDVFTSTSSTLGKFGTWAAVYSNDYYAGATKGVTCSGALTVIASITIKNGLITAATGTGGTCS